MIGRGKARAIPTFFATGRKLSGRNGKQPHNERKLNNMKTKIQRTTPMKQIFLYTSLAEMTLAVTTTGAAPEPCDGTVQLTSQSHSLISESAVTPHRVAAFVSPRSHRNRSPAVATPAPVGALHRTATRKALWLPSLSFQRGANFRGGM